MGDAHRRLSRGKPELLLENLRRIRPDADPEYQARAVREYFRNHYVDRLCIFLFPRMDADAVRRLVEFEGLERLDAALEQGRGAVLAHGHFGPVHVPLVALARLGYPMKQIGMPSDEGLSWIGRRVAFRLRLKYEARIPAEIVNADRFMRPVFQWLQQGGAVMVTGDGRGPAGKRMGAHALFNFFDQPVMFPLGPARLAQKTGAALLPLAVLPGRDAPFRVVVGEPLNTRGKPESAVRQFVRWHQANVAAHPGWMHFLDGFKPGAIIEADPARAETAERKGA
jgi:KDO2-lipid IV(A) lauroyltransferase